MDPSDHSIDVHGLKIHYLEWGNREGEPLVLIHGYLDHARSWEPFVSSLQKKSGKPNWIVAPDCRGHGDSDWIGSGGYYHFPDYLLDLDAVCDALGSPSVSLMGHSMGGTISFLYSGTFPSQVRKLILVEGIGPQSMSFSDAPPRFDRWISEVGGLRQRKPVEYPSLNEAAKRLQKINRRLRLDLALQLARWGMKQTSSGKWIWKFDPLHRTTSPQPFFLGQALEFFHRIECPVLLVRGKESQHSHRTDTQTRQGAITHRTLVEIKNAGHMVHHDNPEDLAEVVSQFLNH